MLLENKHAVIYGAGGPIGAAVARALAREGARVSLAGRTRAKLDELAREMATASGDVAAIAQGYSRPVGAGYALDVVVSEKPSTRRFFAWT